MRQRLLWAAAVASFGLALGPAWADEPDETVETAEVDDSSAAADALFEFLVAEIAAQRGDVEGALSIYHRMARELRDPQIARRAVELAIRVRAYPAAMESASLLLELDPESTLAREIMAALLAGEGDLDKARAAIVTLLDKSRSRGGMLVQLGYLFGKFQDKAAVLEATRSIVGPYPELAESHYALGVAALLANQLDLAGKETEEALSIKPFWEQGAILKAQILRKARPEAVVPFYESFVAQQPGSLEVRMQLGRELAAERKLAAAREQFRETEKLSPKDSQAAYAVGLLSLQLEDFTDAQAAFARSLALGFRDPAAIYLGLGQAAEGMKRVDEAIGWYQKVETGDWCARS